MNYGAKAQKRVFFLKKNVNYSFKMRIFSKMAQNDSRNFLFLAQNKKNRMYYGIFE